MGYEILQNMAGALRNIHVPPVDPLMFWLQRFLQQCISHDSNLLPSVDLRCKSMSCSYILRGNIAKVFKDDSASVEDRGLLTALYVVELGIKDRPGVIDGVSNDETQINEMVRICEIS